MQFMKLFKSFCKKEFISRRITLRNQKIGFSEKDLSTFKTCLLVVRLSLLVVSRRLDQGKAFWKFLLYQRAIKRRLQLVGNMLKVSTKTEHLSKLLVLKNLRRFVEQCRKGLLNSQNSKFPTIADSSWELLFDSFSLAKLRQSSSNSKCVF